VHKEEVQYRLYTCHATRGAHMNTYKNVFLYKLFHCCNCFGSINIANRKRLNHSVTPCTLPMQIVMLVQIMIAAVSKVNLYKLYSVVKYHNFQIGKKLLMKSLYILYHLRLSLVSAVYILKTYSVRLTVTRLFMKFLVFYTNRRFFAVFT
jgi:hypothetical protein